MVLEFIFPFRRLSLVLLTFEKTQEVIEKTSLMHTEAVKVFEYGKNNNGY